MHEQIVMSTLSSCLQLPCSQHNQLAPVEHRAIKGGRGNAII